MSDTLVSLFGDDGAAALTAALRDGAAASLRVGVERWAALFDERRFVAALRRMPRDEAGVRYGAVITDAHGEGLTFTEAIDAADCEVWLARGHTLCASDISSYDDRLAAVAAAIAAELGADDVRFNAYLSPRGAVTPLHTDTRVSTTLQLSGRKRWRYEARAACRSPRSNAQIDRWGDAVWMTPTTGAPPPPPDRPRMLELELGPGDLLCVPAGAWHEVHSLAAGLGLNLSIRRDARDG